MPESYLLPNGGVLVNVHDIGTCIGRYCVLHNPSAHHMRRWPLDWRDDSKIFERECPHGVGHPDPDGQEYLRAIGQVVEHGCDGCCEDATIDGEVVVREITER